MAFFRQLRLLLWKNGLGVLRHPLWSLTLIVWPLIIFLIVAVTREQFPPIVKQTCYVAPRNLPSTGLFPFLQTLMCNTDSTCHNKSRLTTEAGSRVHQRSPRVARSVRPLELPLANLFEGRELLNFSQDARKDAVALIQVLDNFLGPGRQRNMHEALSMMHSMNSTLLGDVASWEETMQSDDALKRSICRLALPMLNTSSPAALAHALVTFCTSNDTLFEVSLMTIYQMMMDQLVAQPEEMGTMAGMVVLLFEQLQDHDSLWEGLLAIPHLLSSGSLDEGMDTLKTLLTNLQRVLSDISGDFPESNATVSALHPGLAGAINLIHYVQNWPGRDVSVSLADVVTLHNDSLSEMMKQVLQLVEIPLDQAAVLSWDKDLVLSHLCDNSSRPLTMALPCITGTLHMLLSWISPDKLAKQCVLQWSKHVAQHDVAFATGLLHSLMGGPDPGGHGGADVTRSRRSLQTQPQNNDEDLFLSVGNVVLEILGNFPEVDQLLQSMLTFAYQSMQMAALGIDSAAETIENACRDASRVEMMLQSLLTNQSESSMLLGRILDSAMEVITKSLSDPEHQNGSCVETLAPLEWLLPNNSFSTEEWRSMMCGNGSLVQHALQMDWMATIEKGFQIADAINPRNMDNGSVTLPMILSAWRQLLNSSMTFGALIETMASGLGGAYWTDWMPDNSTQNMAETLQQSVFWSLVSHGQGLEQSEDWPPMEPYFHMAYWVLNYSPNVTAPPNCSLSSNLFAHCDTGLDWTQFVHLLSNALMSPRLDTLVNCLKGTVSLLHSVYGDVAKYFGEAYLQEELQGADALSTYLTQLLHNLDGFAQNVSALPAGDMQEYQALMQLLQSSGLAPLLPLFTSSGPLNVSAILDAAAKWGRLNQHIFAFNETDPTLPQLEQLLSHFLTFEGNLTVSLSQAMGNSLVTYSDYFHPDDAARFLEAIRPLTNQTSAGTVEAILRSIELLKTVMDAPEGDPAPVILGYLRQFQQFIASLYRLRKVENIWLPDGTPSVVNVTDLSPLSADFLNLLTPESLGTLAQAGADNAQEIVAQKFIAFLPPSIQQEAALFLKDFKDLQGQVATCESGQNCLGVVSEISTFLNQIVDLMQTTDGNVSITLEAPSPYLEEAKEVIASTAFRLLLPPAAATGMETFQQVLDFVKMLTAGPEVTVSSVREALSQSDLTLEDLQAVAAQTGAADTKELALSVMDVIGVNACFQEQAEPQVTAQCVSELVHGIGGFLARVPALRNATALLELLPAVFNQTAGDLARLNFSAGADVAVLHALSKTLDAVKTNLQMTGMATPEIMDEITALEGLLKVAANPAPLNHLFNASADPLHFEKALYEVMQWYLERLENVTQSSAVSELLYPFFRITQVEVALQLAHTEFGLFLSRRIEELMSNLQLPIDHQGLMMIGQTVANSLRRLLDNVMQSFQTQNTYAEVFDQEPAFNATVLDATKQQIQMYLNRIEEWTQQPNVSMALAGVLNWRDFNLSAGADGAMLHALSQALDAVKTNLQMTGMATPEIMDEIAALEGLLKVAADPAPLNHLFNTTADPFHFNKALFEVMQWYLERLENVTQSSAVSELLYPFFRVTQVEVALQLAYTEFSSFLTRQMGDLASNLQLPIDREGVMMVGQTVITSLRRLLDTVKVVLQSQNTYHQIFDEEPPFNATMLDATEHQIHMYLNGIEEWMQQSNVSVALTSMLHWGNFNISASRPLEDVHLLMQNVAPFLSPEQKAFLSLIGNITRSLNAAIAAAEQPGGMDSAHFSAAVVEVYQTVAPLLPMEPLPLPVLEEVQGIVQDSVELLLGQNMSFPASVNMSLHVLWRAEAVVQQALPEEVAAYLLPPIKVATTYFETIATYSGPDNWNQMILNQMETIQSLLPPNSTAQAYVSTLIDITHSILDSGQGNMSLWESFGNGTTDSFPMMLGLAEQLLSAVWPLLSPALGPHMPPPPLGTFAHLPWVFEQLMSGQAQPHTWHRLEHMLTALLSTMVGTEHWDQFTSAVLLFEKMVADAVSSIHAQNALMESLQTPVTALLGQISQSINSSRFNVSELWEGTRRAVEGTLQAAQQANGTLECSAVLEAWEPLGEAAGLSPAAMASWCDVNLRPVLEAYAASQHLYDNLSINHTGMEPETAKEAAARMVAAMQWLYHANANNTALSEQLLSAVMGQLGAPPTLSHQALLHLSQQLQHMHIANSIWSLGALSGQLLSVAPHLRPYLEALESSLSHVLANSNLSAEALTSEQVFAEAAMLFLSHANITKDGAFPAGWGDLPHLMTSVGNLPMLHQAMEQLLGSEPAARLIQTIDQTLTWLASSEASGLELLSQALPRLYEALRTLLSALPPLEMPAQFGPLQELLGNILATERETSPQTRRPPSNLGRPQGRYRREAPPMPPREPIDDFLDLLYIDYPSMFRALAVPPSPEEVMETAHVLFSNPDLGVVMAGATAGLPWAAMNVSQEHAIHAALGFFSFLTLPGAAANMSMDHLPDVLDMLPDRFPFPLIKNLTRVMAYESHENMLLLQQSAQTASELLSTDPTHPLFMDRFQELKSQVCMLERCESGRLLVQAVSMETGQLCHTFLPGLEELLESLQMNGSQLSDAVFQTIVGDPKTFDMQMDWTSVLNEVFDFNISSLSSLQLNFTSPVDVTFGELLRNQSAFAWDVHQHMDFDPPTLQLLLATQLPKSNMEILSWLMDLRHCGSGPPEGATPVQAHLLAAFCSMSAGQWYSFSLLTARHLNTDKLIYSLVLSEEMQGLVGAMLQVTDVLVNMMNKMLPAIGQLETFMLSVQDLNLVSNAEFSQMARGQRSSISSRATFVTLSRALCSKGIMALFGISKLPRSQESEPSFSDQSRREEMIDRFKIPRNATPFCMNMYLDMVNTTGGAIAWAFLKPMLMGDILFAPDTPLTRDIMNKANATLHEFANLRNYSMEWVESSGYIVRSAQLLSRTLPVLQNSLGNAFVKNFIEMQTDINVDSMKETLSSFSNMTVMLQKNRHVLDQLTTLSTLMLNISSCIKFDRYRGFDTPEEMDQVAQDLAKNRDLYGSVIFKLPKDERSSPSSLPPKVRYTIRMHMDNVMRTDRARLPYYVNDPHISARETMRYNRGFVYLQENIERAIIQAQTGATVTQTAVQLQAFPYPCHQRDEYLEAVSFVFPLMLMIAWILFVAEFVKKLVHERELRLHEYMKMMGVSPLSHFFAWFVECASYLGVTIFILTLLLKYGGILPHSDGFLIFLYLCDYGLSVLALSYLISSFFDKTYIAGLSGSLLYILAFFPYIVVMAVETSLTFSQKSLLSLFSPTCFSYASQYITRYESQGEGIQWSNSYHSPIAEDTASFGWLCWLMLIDSALYFVIGAYIRMVFPGAYGLAAPWYFPFTASFWSELCCCAKSRKAPKGLFITNIMQDNQQAFPDDKAKGVGDFSSQTGGDFSHLPVGVNLLGLTKTYGERTAIHNLNVAFYEGHVTALLGHNGAGKTTTMSLLTGLFAPSSGSIEVYGRDMQSNLDEVRRELGVCMQYDVLFDHMTAEEHLLLYGQIKAPHWSKRELKEQVRTILAETGMLAHRGKRVGTLSGGMRRKLSISIAFIGGSRLVVLDEPTTGVDPCSRRSIWDIVIQHKKQRTIIMSTHHLDEAEVLSDRIAFLERGGLKCCGSPFYLKDKLGQGYKLTLTKKMGSAENFDAAEMKSFIQAHVAEARLKEAQGGDLVYSLPPFTSANASAYRSLLTALDANLHALQLSGYGVSDTTLEEVFLQLTQGSTDDADAADAASKDTAPSVSHTISQSDSMESLPNEPTFSDTKRLTSSVWVRGAALAWQQMVAIVVKRFHHSRRDYKGLLSQLLLPVLFVIFAMALGSIKSDLRHYPELELSPALYKVGPSFSFFSNQNPSSKNLADTMMSFPGIDNSCLDGSGDRVCSKRRSGGGGGGKWESSGNSSKAFNLCKCTQETQVCDEDQFQPPHRRAPSSQTVYNLSGIDMETYLVSTSRNFIRNRYGGFEFGKPLPPDLQMDLRAVPKNRTLSKVWFNPDGHHTMPAYLNSLNNFILRSNIPADKDPSQYAISVSSHPYFGRVDNEDAVVQGMLQILVAMCVLTGYSITTAGFAIYEVKEHHTGSKRLQHIAGISEPFYWTINFLYDMVVYMVPVTLTIIVVAAFQIPAFTDRQNLAAVTMLLVLFGFATFPWMYLLAGVFRNAEMAFIIYVCINLFISVNTIMSSSILYFLGQISERKREGIQVIFGQLCKAFHIFPQFNFGNGLMQLARKNIEVQLLSGYGIDAYQDPFSMDALGSMFLASFIQGLVFFTLRLLLNRFLLRKIRHLVVGRKTVSRLPGENEDEDVAAEHQRVSSGAASSDVLQVNQLSKVFQSFSRKVQAVKHLSLGVPAGECFGLLGVNGAGKTTTFKMLTGDVSPTDGTAQIRDRDGRLVDIMECRNEGINIGYCPQVDALDELLTGEEHLYFYARIRGTPKSEIDQVVNYLLRRLELTSHRGIVTDGYSCGTRRKLSTALALIGHPQILLLDEPSSGMDPRTKRHLWKIISEEVKGKCAVVLTSHSMEECEALCGRLAIMVKGQFRCLGSLQHIKNRFGSGFTVKMYLAEAGADVEVISGFMQGRFPSTYLKDQHSSMVEYHVPVAPGGVAHIFDQLESSKGALRIKHFSVSQTTLDEVFINFAMGKVEAGSRRVPSHDHDDDDDDPDDMKEVQT